MKPFLSRLAIVLILSCGLLPAFANPRVQLQHLREKGSGYTIDVQVPQIVNPTAAQSAINMKIMKDARADVAAFAKQAKDDHASSKDLLAYEMESGVTVHLLNDRWFSFEQMTSQYTGGAHPNPLVATELWDLKRGRALSLKDLFKSGVDFLQPLSEICKKEINGRDLGWELSDRDKGLEPKAENYTTFYVDGTNLVVVFPPYQVGPYSAGTQEVKIPYKDLQAMAAPQGPLH